MFKKQVFIVCMLFIFATAATAGTSHYTYDDGGRLSAVTDDNNNYVGYEYDSVGNLLSITTGTTSPNPPVIQSIIPDTLFIGAETVFIISGHDLLTSKTVTFSDQNISAKVLSVSDTAIKVDATVLSTAVTSTINVTLTTDYGSASSSLYLAASKLSFVPNPVSVSVGGSSSLTAVIEPPLQRPLTIQLTTSDNSVATVPASITVPASGYFVFGVNGGRKGVTTVSSGSSDATVYVTDQFVPQSGEQLTNYPKPVSVYIDSPSSVSNTTAASLASVYIDVSKSGTAISRAVSVKIQ